MESYPHIRLKDLCERYLEISENAYSEKIRFYERHYEYFTLLRVSKYMYFQYDYIDALYSLGDYEKFLDRAQIFLEESIYHNICYIRGNEIYLQTIKKIAYVQYLLKKYKEAKNTAKEYLKMNFDKDMSRVLFLSYKGEYNPIIKKLKNLLIIVLVVTVSSLILEQVLSALQLLESNFWYLQNVTIYSLMVIILIFCTELTIIIMCILKVKRDLKKIFKS